VGGGGQGGGRESTDNVVDIFLLEHLRRNKHGLLSKILCFYPINLKEAIILSYLIIAGEM
jgi:hypothetical protein